MKKRINKQKAIELILNELEKGSTYTHCLEVIRRKWTLADTTYQRYWKEARSLYEGMQEAIREKLKDELLKAERERIKKAILTKDERMLEASKIARGEGRKISGSVFIPNDRDRLQALDYLSKIEGDYAPEKIDHTTDGESLNKKEVDPLAPIELRVNVIERKVEDGDVQRTTTEGISE